MKHELQIKALAELDGKSKFASEYLHCCEYAVEQLNNTGLGESPYSKEFEAKWDFVRRHVDYLNSYDAIIPLIQKQPLEIRDRIATKGGPISFMVTPAELCEKLLRATGEWKDEEV